MCLSRVEIEADAHGVSSRKKIALRALQSFCAIITLCIIAHVGGRMAYGHKIAREANGLQYRVPSSRNQLTLSELQV